MIKADRNLTAYRIGDPDGQHPIYDAEGSRLYPGRWNTARAPIIYASEHYSTAMLEKILHLGSELPPNQHFIRIDIPKGTSIEYFLPDAHSGWDKSQTLTRKYGTQWCLEARSAVLAVPCIAARMENNFLINPAHPEFSNISYEQPKPVWWDDRLL